MNPLPKTLLTKKTEDNYDLMMQYFRKDNYKRGDDYVIEGIINYDDFSSDKFLGLASEKIKIDNTNKNIIEDFIQRNIDDTKLRQDNNKAINNRIKSIDESTKKKLYFNNRQSQQEYFDSFYNKQMQYKNNYKNKLDKLAQKYNEERKKNYEPEPKYKNNLDYFKNAKPIKLPRYSFNDYNPNDINCTEGNIKENSKENKTQNSAIKSKIKKYITFDKNKNNINNSSNNYDKNDINNNSNNNNNESKKLKKIKSGPLLNHNIKLTKKEIEELSNKLHYDGELLKIKKKAVINEELANAPDISNYSKDILSHSSIIILIKKILYEYGTSVKKNAYADYTKNPKLNYEQYIDIFKDLYYLPMDAPPEDYLDEDSIYKELWKQ
jgi:hypothetical protein